jgi:exopolyphosphatase/guanosine-5'-triphosphate,3'-diphosphate pyrophosphatase
VKLAAIDIGSNSIKLVVVDAAASDSFAVLAREKESIRLGHETLRRHRLAPEAIERAAETIKRFRSIAEARGAESIVAVATASVREAHNSAEFIKEIDRRTGVRVEVLSSIEEARLIGVAASQGCAPAGVPLLNIDIGGGSTEISVMRDGVPVELFSVKLGAVGLTDKFIANDPPKAKEVRALREEVRAAFERPGRELRGVLWQQATGTSGTILAIGDALRLQRLRDATDDQQGAQPSSSEIPLSQLEQFNQRISRATISDRRGIPGISSQRAEIIVAGGQILEGVMHALRLNVLGTCDWALREGVIIERLREMEAESRPPVPNVADQKLLSVQAVGRRFGYEEVHARQVARLAETIFDSVAETYELTRHQRTLLSAAALLHDAGYHIAHDSHHKHTLYLIKHSELTGFSESERNVIANVARYHRGALPRERHLDFASLNQTDRDTVWRLGSIVRIADALDRRYDGRVRDLRCTLDGKLAHIQLRSDQPCDREIQAAEQKGDMFEQAFDCTLSFSSRALAKGIKAAKPAKPAVKAS